VDENDIMTMDRAAFRFAPGKLLSGMRSCCQLPVRLVTLKDVFVLAVDEQLDAHLSSAVKAAPDTGALISNCTCVYELV